MKTILHSSNLWNNNWTKNHKNSQKNQKILSRKYKIKNTNHKPIHNQIQINKIAFSLKITVINCLFNKYIDRSSTLSKNHFNSITNYPMNMMITVCSNGQKEMIARMKISPVKKYTNNFSHVLIMKANVIPIKIGKNL